MRKAHVAAALILLLAAPAAAFAMTSQEANKACAQWQANGGTGVQTYQTTQPGGGTVTCQCGGSVCNATAFTDANGNMKTIQNAMSFLGQALGIVSQLMNMQGSGSGSSNTSGGGSVSVPSVSLPTQNNLPSFAPASNLTPVAPPTSPSPVQIQTQTTQTPPPDTSGAFLEAVAKGFNNITNAVTQVTVGIVQPAPSVPPPPAATQQQQTQNQPTTNVQTNSEGSTIVIDQNTNGISGFYGAANSAGQASLQGFSLIGRLCVTRPWANSFVIWLIPASFFDGLCAKGGYDVGPLPPPSNGVNATQIVLRAQQRAATDDLAPANTVQTGITCTPNVIRQGASARLSFSCGTGYLLARSYGFTAGVNDTTATVQPQTTTDYGISCSNAAQYTCAVKVVNPRIVITADPQSVRLGSRTVIHWNTQDVDGASCVISGPSFKGNGASGAGSTVPITGSAVFTATCNALDGQPITQTLTVDLAL